jgi:ABC-type dipeptide/oligopeptide/nickel transport system ATPase component
VGRQLTECIRLHDPTAEARQRARQLLRQVGFSDPGRILKSYPHNLSGGQRQRMCIAMAIAGRPKLMIADEPTTALDVTVQAQVLGLLQQLSRELNMAVLLITHDLSVVAAICRWVAVMYRGQVVEWGTAEQIFCAPNHPYTQKLLREERP